MGFRSILYRIKSRRKFYIEIYVHLTDETKENIYFTRFSYNNSIGGVLEFSNDAEKMLVKVFRFCCSCNRYQKLRSVLIKSN